MPIFKENISSSSILNRKLIVEFRFSPVASFLDKKGEILEAMTPLIPNSFWSFGDVALRISDANTAEKARSSIAVEINRFAYVLSKIDTLQKFVDDVTQMYSILKKVFPTIRIQRIGCRIQGTYKTRSRNFNDVVQGFRKSFPSDTFFDGFELNDLRIEIKHNQGMYILGPVNENDSFLTQDFTYEGRNNSVGIGLDTDNFLIETINGELNDEEKVYDVIRASLSVEKSFVEKFGSL